MTLHFFSVKTLTHLKVVFFCTAFLAFIEFYFVKLLHCISGQCEIYACSVFSLFCLPLDFSVKLIAHMKIFAGGGLG